MPLSDSDTPNGPQDRLFACAEAHPNIALVKYWGKRDAGLNLPAVGSLSITLDSLWSRTRVHFDDRLEADDCRLDGRADAAQTRRSRACLDLLRARAGIDTRARVDSHNNFPTGAGLASSASGFAALVTAGAAALKLSLTPEEASAMARRCSGSAARSLFGGFVEWQRGERDDGADSIARPLQPADYWPLRVVVAVTSRQAKDVGSTEGMNRTAETSPYQSAWEAGQEADLTDARAAVDSRDFERLAEVSEHSCLKMHALAMAARPGLLYWNGATVEALQRIRALRREGHPVFFTIDAGPQLKAVCLPEAESAVREALADTPGVLDLLCTGLGEGARLLDPALMPADEAHAA